MDRKYSLYEVNQYETFIDMLTDDDHREDIPPYTLDVHTLKGKMAGKTKTQFFAEEHAALEPRQIGFFDDLVPGMR